MPYFGRTKYAVADDYGPMSRAVYHFTTHELLCVALEVGEGFVFTHNGILYIAEGVVSLCKAVEALPEYLGFSLTEKAIKSAIAEFRALGDIMREEEK